MMTSDNIYLKMIEDIEDYAILLLDKDGNIETWNKGAEKIKGYKQEEVIGKNFKIFYTEEDQKNDLPQQLIVAAKENGKAIYEGWRVRKDGTMFWGSIVATTLYNDKKELIGFTKVTRDLTEKKLAEERLLQFNHELEQKVKEQTAELYRNERRFKALVEHNNEAISLRDANGNLLYQSPGAEKMTGYTFEEAKNINQLGLMHADDVANAEEMVKMALQHSGQAIYGIQRIRHRSGHDIWIEGTLTNMLEDENVQALVRNFRDITERKQAEEKIMYVNRLYAFVSAINQTIVHVRDEHTLYNEACRIAIEIGKFETAWISIPDKVTKQINIVAHHNTMHSDLKFFSSRVYNENNPKDRLLEKGDLFIVNDIKNEPASNEAKDFAISRGFHSYIALPIIKSGVTIGALNLNALQTNIFDEQEIKLLKEVAGDISFALDVFEKEKNRKSGEEKIKNSELRLRQAQAIAHIGSWELSFKTGVGIWSEEACRIYGLDPADNVHSLEKWLSFIHPEDLDYVKKITQGQNRAAFFHRIIRKDGNIRHIHTQAEADFRNDAAVGLYGIVHDITDMKVAEEALQQSMTNLTLILNLIPQLVFVKDYNGRFVFANKGFSSLYGLSPEDLIGKTLPETMPGSNDPDYFIKQDREIINTGITKILPEVAFTDYTGKRRIFYTVKVPYTVTGTNERAVLGIARDITEQKSIEAERTKMVSDIVQRNKDLEQFSYIVSHNLRSPVANIIGLATLFKIGGSDEAETKIMMDQLSFTVAKLDEVIKDLNHILQVRNQVSESRTQMRFSALLSDIKVSIGNLMKDADVKIISDFSEADEIFSIKTYLYSIFFNLISNSIKYRRSGIQPVIEIMSRRNRDDIELIFKDNGLGIDLKRKGEYVFGLYKRFHDHAEGKGIGLYMVKAQVETLGGKISVESEVNTGTTFKIVFQNSKLNA